MYTNFEGWVRDYTKMMELQIKLEVNQRVFKKVNGILPFPVVDSMGPRKSVAELFSFLRCLLLSIKRRQTNDIQSVEEGVYREVVWRASIEVIIADMIMQVPIRRYLLTYAQLDCKPTVPQTADNQDLEVTI